MGRRLCSAHRRQRERTAEAAAGEAHGDDGVDADEELATVSPE